MKEENDIDKLFRDSLEKHQMQAPPNSWDLLNTDLDRVAPDKERKRRRFLIPFLLLLLLVGGYFYFSNNNYYTTNNSKANSEKQVDKIDNNDIVSNNYSSQSETKIAIPKSPKLQDEEEITAETKSSNNKISKNQITDASSNTDNASNSGSFLKETNNQKLKTKSKLKKEVSKVPTITSKSKKKKALIPNNKLDKTLKSKKQDYVNLENRNSNDQKELSKSIITDSEKQIKTIDQDSIWYADLYIPGNKINSNEEPNNKIINEDTIKARGSLNDNKITNLDSLKSDSLSKTNSALVVNPEIEVKKRSPFSFEIFGAPLYTINYMRDDSPNNQIDDPGAYAKRENSRFSFSTGIAMRYHLNERFSFSLGAYYSSIAYAVAVTRIYANIGTDSKPHFQYLTSWGTIQMPYFYPGQIINVGDSLDFNTTCEQVVKFINIPIIARYNITNYKFSWFIDAGFSINFKTNERAVIKVDDEEYAYENERIGIKDMNYYAILGVGGSYNFNNKLSVFAEPIIRASISSITENIPVKTYPNSFGLNIGLSYRF